MRHAMYIWRHIKLKILGKIHCDFREKCIRNLEFRDNLHLRARISGTKKADFVCATPRKNIGGARVTPLPPTSIGGGALMHLSTVYNIYCSTPDTFRVQKLQS